MCNTRWIDFLQSMKNITLSVRNSTKKLILRALRQLYAVSVINILIWWVTPPPNLKFLKLNFFKAEFLQKLIFFKTVVLQTCFSSKLEFIIMTLCDKILKLIKIFKTLDNFYLPRYIYIYRLWFQSPQQHSLIAISLIWYFI